MSKINLNGVVSFLALSGLTSTAAFGAEDATACAERLINKNFRQSVSAKLLARKITNVCWAPLAPTGFDGEMKATVEAKFVEFKRSFAITVYDGIQEKRADKGIKLRN